MPDISIVETSENTVQIIIETTGCEFKKSGSCIMCNYGQGSSFKPEELKHKLESKITPIIKNYNVVVFDAYGSLFDIHEFGYENFIVLLDYIAKTNISYVVFETHAKTISNRILKIVRDKLPNQMGSIELGLETSTNYIMTNCLNKYQSVEDVERAIDLIKQYNFDVDLNILFGIPFMNVAKQIDTTLKDIKWAYDHGASKICLFPCNIKSSTPLYRLYRLGQYKGLYQWDFINLLNKIPDNMLDKIQILWYGNRKVVDKETGLRNIAPYSCQICKKAIEDFYDDFVNNNDSEHRRKLLNKIIDSDINCSCKLTSYKNMQQKPDMLKYIDIQVLLRALKEN